MDIRIKLTFAEGLSGCKKTINTEKRIVCEVCNGSGAKHGSKPKECSTCRGSGHVKQRSQTFFGVIEQTVICPACHGAGELIEDKCTHCHGEKRVLTKEEKEISVPAGIDNEMTIKMSGEGHQ